MTAKPSKKIFNPFEGRNRDEVWKEIHKYLRSRTPEETARALKEGAEMQRKVRQRLGLE